MQIRAVDIGNIVLMRMHVSILPPFDGNINRCSFITHLASLILREGIEKME
jgi:hypothetical protein